MAEEKIILEVVLNTQDAQKQVEGLRKTIEEQTEAMRGMAKGTEEYKKATAALKENKDAHTRLTKVVKEQESAQKALDAQRRKALEQIAKQEQKQRDLIATANMEAKSYEDMSRKMSALNTLRKQQDLTTEEGRAAYDAMTQEVLGLNNALIKMDEQINVNSRKVGSYTQALETTNMSLGEMKRTLRELRNIPLAGKTPEEIAQVEKQIAMLTDEMGDYQARMRASGDSVQVMIEGLQGIVAVAQGVTAGLSAMGFNTEKLDKAMVQLIGVSQALATIHQLQEKQTLKTVATVIKDTYAKVANAVATKAQTMATEGATVATRVFGNALKSVPLVAIIAAVAAVASALVILAVKMRQANAETRMMNKVNAEAAKSTADERANLDILVGIAKDHSRSITERRKAIEAINKISPEYLGNITLENIGTDKSVVAIENYINALDRKARSQAYNNLLTEKYTELAEEEAKTYDELSVAEQAYYMSLATLNLGSGLSGSELYNLEQGKRIGDIYKEINALKKLAYQYAEVDDIVQDTGDTGKRIVLDKLTKDAQETQKQIVDIWSEIDEAFDAEINTTETQKAIENMGFALKSFEREKTVLDTMFDGMIEGMEKADVTMQITKTDFQVAVGAMKNAIDDYGSTAQTVYGSLNEIIANNSESQLMAVDALQKKSDEYYKQRFAEAEGDEEMQESLKRSQEAKNKALEKQRNEIALKQAKMEKARALFDIAIKTAVAIISQLVATPLPYGAPFVAAVGVAGLAQAAAIASRPLPQFSEGGYTGKGRKYDPAGIVHKGEVVFNQEDVNALGGAQAVNAMRPTAKNQYWTGGIVGFGATGAAGAYNNATIEAIRGLTVVATIEDINAKMFSEQKRMNIASI
jgi:hypothetical protein